MQLMRRSHLAVNVYNLCVMHGNVAFSRRVSSANLDALRVLELHSRRFVYEIGGLSFSAIQIEHAVLRAASPRPAFIGTSLLIPKFRQSDPRRGVCPLGRRTPLLMFGLVPGASFGPPLRVFGSTGLDDALADAARRFLAGKVSVHTASARAGATVAKPLVTLPIQRKRARDFNR